MAVAGSAVSSIMLRLDLTRLHEGATMLRHRSVVVEDVGEACRLLETGETIYLRLLGDELARVRERMAAYLAATQETPGDD